MSSRKPYQSANRTVRWSRQARRRWTNTCFLGQHALRGVEEAAARARQAREQAAADHKAARAHAASIKETVLAGAKSELETGARICAEEGFKNRVRYSREHRQVDGFGKHPNSASACPMNQRAWYVGHHVPALLHVDGTLLLAHVVDWQDNSAPCAHA